MGSDKALLPWGATDLLGHALSRLHEVADEVRILAGPEPRYAERGLAVDCDRVADGGPLAGLVAALEGTGPRAALLLGIDVPLVSARLLARLVELAAGFDAVVPVSPHGPEPLCAVYRPSCLVPARLRLEARQRTMTSFWAEVRVREVAAAELGEFGDPATLFLNVNTREDYEEALRLRG
jgi:molybdopterin-guanine dinucleotide biosynthesis protein A